MPLPLLPLLPLVPLELLPLAPLCGALGLGEERPSCPAGTFRAAPEPEGCLPCDVCDQGRTYLRRCQPRANAVCRCPEGRDCGGNACLPCQPHTRPPTDRRPQAETGLRRCPEGEFRAQRRRRRRRRRGAPCRPWSRCPNGQILKPGTEESDVVCQPEPTRPPTPTMGAFSSKMTAPPETNGQLAPIGVAVAALLLCLLALFLSSFVFKSWTQGKSREVGSSCHGQPAQEMDDCSYCYPEEEEGGGSSCSEASGAKWELLPEKVS